MNDLKILKTESGQQVVDYDYAKGIIEQQQQRIDELVKRLSHIEQGEQATIAHQRVKIEELSATVERLREAVNNAGAAIAMLPENALGEVPDNHERQGWFIRDELIYNLGQAAKATPQATLAERDAEYVFPTTTEPPEE